MLSNTTNSDELSTTFVDKDDTDPILYVTAPGSVYVFDVTYVDVLAMDDNMLNLYVPAVNPNVIALDVSPVILIFFNNTQSL